MIARRIALLATLLLALPAAAQVPAQGFIYSVKKDASNLTYKLHHPLHEVVGKAPPSDGKARLLPDGTLQVNVRANVKDFDSGNSNRDAHMQEATEAAKFPLVDFKGQAKGVKLPTTFPATVPVTLKGELTFHGVKQGMDVPMKVTFTSEKEATATGTFDVSLDTHKVERPSLLMKKVDDKLVLETTLKFVVEGK
ncbi:YceI family protein [Pyxidicoccus xibeiensis]|uniref:YceI family protein n=1 Tax=Pyxidicoccus xibeiensis TaxID=2906759 RepID=UPI0020A80BA8|nr:YceI family protein [Pyxidicoccus xibeiensis]MCP3137261.1 YceI family protein [Pyxidicoccus xibeiensis]